MNKYIFCLAAAALTLGFTACEDVPAPYGINDTKPDTPSEENIILEAPFTSSLSSTIGEFTTQQTVGNYPFTIDGSYGYVKVTSYDSEAKTNNAAESWLISPSFSLKDKTEAHINLDYILRYATTSELKTNYLIRFSTDYYNDPATATWTDVSFNPVQVSDWDTWTTADVNVPSEVLGQENVTVALYYKADTKSATWELKNFKLLEGKAGSGEVEEGTRSLPYAESFATSMGGFKNYTTSGEGEWTIDYSTAKATGYNNTTKVTTAGTYYLVSPEISLEGQTAAHVSYEYILRYNKGDENQQVFITSNFDENNPTEGWTALVASHKEGSDWQTFEKTDVAIPTEYMGKKIRIAFRYNTNSESGSTWEVKNFAIAAGEPGSSETPSTPTTPDTPSTPAGESITENSGFEAWEGSTPVAWKSTTNAGNATLSQSTDAHSGQYAVLVKTGNSQNKRLGSKEYTLEAGTYRITCYVKGAGQVQVGYVPVVNGAIESGSSYKYLGYVSTNADDWTEVTGEFTLTEETVVNFLLMNPKGSTYAAASDKLVDDFTVVKVTSSAANHR